MKPLENTRHACQPSCGRPLLGGTGLRRQATCLLVIGLSAAAWAGEAPLAPDPAKARINYSVGYQFGSHLHGLERQGVAIDLQPLFRGILEALAGSTPFLSADEMRAALEGIERPMVVDSQNTTLEPRSNQTLARERGYIDDFAALNARRKGVVTLASGVQYEVLRRGGGKQPRPGDTLTVSYQGTLTDGVVFDSTYEDVKPTSLRMDEIVVPGLKEALLHMQEGAKWRVVIPPSMGFRSSGNNLLRKRDLIYEIELVSVEAATAPTVPGAESTAPGAAVDQRGKASSAEAKPPR